VPKFALVAKRQPLKLSIPLQSFLLSFGRICEAAQFGLFRDQHRGRINHQVITESSKRWEQNQR
jgi:hypothetical protein